MTMRDLAAAAALLLLAAQPLTARDGAAAEIRVLTAGALRPMVVAVVPEFERRGHAVTVGNDTAGALTNRIGGGEFCDVAVLTTGALRSLAGRGAVDAAAARTLARVGIGLAVRQGAPEPDISTVEAFTAAVLAAPSFAYLDPAAGGSSGLYLAELFRRLGIEREVAAKAVLVPGGHVADRLVDGSAGLAAHQISELRAVAGITILGPLPAAIQNYTTYVAAPCTATRAPEAARAFTEHLASPAAAALLEGMGMEPAR